MKDRSGAVLIEALMGAGLVVVAVSFAGILTFQAWAKTFATTEAYFLARAHLYGRSICEPASGLVNQAIIRRQVFCQKSTVTTRYSILHSTAHDLSLTIGGW